MRTKFDIYIFIITLTRINIFYVQNVLVIVDSAGTFVSDIQIFYCNISAYTAQNTIHLKLNFCLHILDKISTEANVKGWNLFALGTVLLSDFPFLAKKC